MSIILNTQNFIAKHNLFQKNETILIATSGGADSVVLCNIFYELKFNFAIAHCNFNLRGAESVRDEIFVKALAEKYKVPFHVIHFDTSAISKAEKKSIEETSRNLRYNWFNELIAQHNYAFVATAHHADDNIETVVMNFFRGTGIVGLKGIQPKNNKVIRPILFVRKNELLEYAKVKNLDFVTDSTNAENDYTRNFFRNNILPQIEKVYPAVSENLLQNIDRMGDAAILYEQQITIAKSKLIEKRGDETYIPALKLLKEKTLNTIVYEIIKDYNFTANQTNEVVKLLKSDSGKYITSTTHRILKNRNWIIISQIQSQENAFYLLENINDVIDLPIGKLKITEAEKDFSLKRESNICYINAANLKFPLIVRKWKTGDYFYPLGMQKKKKLSRFFIDQKLSLIEKENIWVVEADKKIVWIINRRIDDRFKVSETNSTNILKLVFGK